MAARAVDLAHGAACWPSCFSRLAGLRLTLAGRNLAPSPTTRIDPAVEAGGDSNFNQNEFNTQPPVRYMMIRLDYNF